MKERFETRLTPEEAGRVEMDMMRLGARSRAAYLRDCLLAGSAGRAEALARQLGVLGILLNALVRIDDARDTSLKPVIRSTTRLLREISRQLKYWRD